MGYMKHHAIVVTSWSEEHIRRAHTKAEELGLTALLQPTEGVNGYRSILICPDGSKEGWDESDRGDERRDAFVAYLESVKYDDGSSQLDWFEAYFGSDDKKAQVTRSAWG